jgi:hypothetical protein
MLEALRSISTSTSHVTSTANQVAAASHHEAAAASVELSAPPPPIPSDAQVASQLQHSDSPPVRPVARSSLPSEPVSSTPQVPDNIRTLLESRGQRLEQERVARETAEKAARDERIRERKTKDAEKAAAATPSDSVGKNRSYEAEQAKRKRDAKLDRERVLKQIENDKIARREKEERRKAAARGEQEPFPQQSLAPITSASKAATTGTTCALQIRLHDGSRIRNSFPATATLLTTVRPWIATESPESKDLFTLKLMQTPQPPRSLSDADEAMTLQELGLLPSATLVVVPVRGAVSTAYSGGTGGVFARIYAMLMGLIMWLIEMVQTFAGNRQQQAPSTSIDVSRAEESSSSASPATGNDAAPSSKIRIRTLKDKGNDNEKREFYNGNQVCLSAQNWVRTHTCVTFRSLFADIVSCTVELRAETER